MLRRLLAVTFLAGSVAAVSAAERATFLLTNGERITGVVAYSGSSIFRRAAQGDFLVRPDGGDVRTVPADTVALIDFVGGQPPVNELAALDDETPHTISLRTGTFLYGRLVGLVAGDFARWENLNGQRQDIPLRNIRRIFLNAESTRTQYGFRASQPGNARDLEARGSGRGWARGRQGDNGLFVSGNMTWTDTGVTVQRGEPIRFRARGEIAYSHNAGEAAGPDGNRALRRDAYPLSGEGVGALIGRVNNGRPFLIGSSMEPIAMPASGRLFLGINDDNFGDNSGGFRVIVMRNQ